MGKNCIIQICFSIFALHYNFLNMATINFRLSSKTDKATKLHEVLVRFRHGNIDQYAKTNIFVNHEYWNGKKQSIDFPNWRALNDEKKQIINDLHEANEKLSQLSKLISSSFQKAGAGKIKLSKDWLSNIILSSTFDIEQQDDVEENTPNADILFDTFDNFINNHRVSEHTKRQFRVVNRTLKRFNLYYDLQLTLSNFTIDHLRMFEKFLSEEHTLTDKKKYIAVSKQVPESRKPLPRGGNSISSTLQKLRTFFNWLIDNDLIKENPFKHYKVIEESYGTPYYITTQERDILYQFDFSQYPKHLARQRDIFVFQCFIGCRISDLFQMTKKNIINGMIEYIPRKTKEDRATIVRVPLHKTAREIIDRYSDINRKSILPFTSQQQYNRDIKEIFRVAGLNRMVTILNPTTREEEQRPLWEVASSHLARRTFVGNLYKITPDPNIICKMSGHKEGSRAFSRYRDIDEEIMENLINKL